MCPGISKYLKGEADVKLRIECLFNVSALYVLAEISQRLKDISVNQCMPSWSLWVGACVCQRVGEHVCVCLCERVRMDSHVFV